MVHWLISLPLKNNRRDATWEHLQEHTSAASLGHNFKFEIPELRIGTLDTLMALSDDLAKTNNMMDAVVSKIRRTVQEVGGDIASGSLKVDGLPAKAYLTRFKWDEAKYPVRRPLKECVEKITEVVSRIEDDLKVRLALVMWLLLLFVVVVVVVWWWPRVVYLWLLLLGHMIVKVGVRACVHLSSSVLCVCDAGEDQ